jgi:hypothetical protein
MNHVNLAVREIGVPEAFTEGESPLTDWETIVSHAGFPQVRFSLISDSRAREDRQPSHGHQFHIENQFQ